MSTSDFTGKRALVTGGSRGIGRAAALELARRGAGVAILYRSRDAEAAETEATIRALGRRALVLKADLADAMGVQAAVAKAAQELGGIEVLVQAAGAMGAWSEAAELSVEEWDRYLAVECVEKALQAGRLGHAFKKPSRPPRESPVVILASWKGR